MKLGSITIKTPARVLDDGSTVLDTPITNAMVLAEVLKHGNPSNPVIRERDEDRWFIQGDAGPNSVLRTLGVFRFGNGQDWIDVWVVNQRRSIMQFSGAKSIILEVPCDSKGFLGEYITIPQVIDTIITRINNNTDDGYAYSKPEPNACLFTHDRIGTDEIITHVGVYKLVFKSDVYEGWRVWVVKAKDNKKPESELLRSGSGEHTHYFASSRNGACVRKSRDSVRDFVFDTIKREYPLGARCRIRNSTIYDHIIVGHQFGSKPVIQVHPINPLHSNDTFSNWYINDVHVMGKA
jgi:hypothetical protein